jgi:murein DD-endopeptidase MepM/ murein hydrolase activator NlpD
VRFNAQQRRRAVWLTAIGLCALVIAILLLNLASVRDGSPSHDNSPLKSHARKAPLVAPTLLAAPAIKASPAAQANDSHSATNEATPAAPPPSGFATSMIPSGPVTDSDVAALKAKELLIPVAGIQANQLRDTFYAGRSEGRTHEALDIMAAGGTPVLAAADGTIVKLFQSDKGGITLYQLDPSGLFIYYYAHLQRYADGVSEGKAVRRGEVIAYVGDTGNAGADNYHLHFAISKPVASRKWSGGLPINPYPILAGK